MKKTVYACDICEVELRDDINPFGNFRQHGFEDMHFCPGCVKEVAEAIHDLKVNRTIEVFHHSKTK